MRKIASILNWLFGSMFGRPKESASELDGVKFDSGWNALPGGVLELGDTGWQIKFKPSDGPDYILFTPEGRQLASCQDGNLGALKAHAEHCARQRAEFTPRKPIWP